MALKSERKIVTIKPGSLLLFRGDMIHCGAAYTSLNIRLHCYLHLKNRVHRSNVTQIIYFQTFPCHQCGFSKLFSPTERLQHQKECNVYYCTICDVSFQKKKAYDMHVYRNH